MLTGCTKLLLEAPVLSDAGRFQTDHGASVAHAIAQRVATVERNAFSNAEQRDEFLRMFGGAGHNTAP